MKQITIAIDGYSSTGKSTVAKRLAKALNYIYVDTGAMYRAVTLYALDQNLITDEHLDVQGVVNAVEKLKLNFVLNLDTQQGEIHLNGANVEGKIRNLRVSRKVSKIAAIPEVRNKLVALQQKMGEDKGVVMDGRDIGTVVFPNAELKLFMTASAEKRANRRYKELLERGEEVSYDAVLKNVQERDHIDSTRKTSPLKKAADAIEFDNSDMGLDEQFERIHQFALRLINK
ncbi:(d)CMP kinase [Flavobacterium sp. ASW18X]|uniref:(d)CMP kinase n=1 Tax=Flavobacterium sp. ASW18X TaxID=2572595 RepID=UPI0010ADFC90|nr:(d)CMP kinase [Flavobacterium sp. ASW18X]TKD63442.1 (d)CMP kinase [Flavobacterium sp. ASW18X]